MAIVIKTKNSPLPKQRIEMIEREMDSLGIREEYDALVETGMAPTMAAMVLCQKTPSTKCDREFTRREHARMSSMTDEERDSITDIAKRAGINTHGKTYNGQLGTYSDPLAWVSDSHDVRNALDEKGWAVGGEGMFKHDGTKGPPKKKRIAKDILDRLEVNARQKDKQLDTKCRENTGVRKELRKKLTEKHTKKPSE